jgi:hypothetical protein
MDLYGIVGSPKPEVSFAGQQVSKIINEFTFPKKNNIITI